MPTTPADFCAELTWRIVYIGQASNPAFDLVLQDAVMDCQQAGQLKFNLTAPAPQPSRLPEQDIVGVTAVLLTCSYKDNQEFVRVGYYVNVEYDSPELNEQPPAKPEVSRLTRHILAEKPRVTKFLIDWDSSQQPNQQEEGLMDKGTQLQDRHNLMSNAALAEAAQNFHGA